MDAQAYPQHVSVTAARCALDAVLASPQFRASPRLASFLRFVVTAALDGGGDRLKGYTVAVEALGRTESFDPQSDAAVRVAAVRLRRALADYYSGEGARDPVVIELPRGGYAPRFRIGRRSAPKTIWRRARRALERLLAASGQPLLPPRPTELQPSHGRQDREAEGAPAARPRRPWPRRDRGDAAHDRGDPCGL